MKPAFPRLASFSMLFAIVVVTLPFHAHSMFDSSVRNPQSNLLQVTPTETPTETPTNTPPPSATSEPAGSFIRPQIGVQNYRTNPVNVRYGEDFKLFVKLRNEGHAHAYNVQVAFTSADFIPLKNGGVVIVGDLSAGNSVDLEQSLTAATFLFGKTFAPVDMNLSYADENGAAFTEKFTLNIAVAGGGFISAATSTPTGVKSSQLVITSYASSIDPLQPGEQFNLTMTVQNTGNIPAQRVTMIVGGGSGGGSSSGTPQPGGVSGGSGEFTNFAPVGASNVQTLGDLPAGGMIQASQSLIVNVSTNPGAYPMKVTFSYINDNNEVINDEQVITLLVYSLPNVDVSFYRPPDPFFVGQPGALPLQVANIGKRLAVLGTMKVTSQDGFIENGTSLIGSLDQGGYFTLDSVFVPEQAGTMTLDITIDYTDDFNQPRTLTRTLEVEVMEAFIEPTPDPSIGGGEEFPIVTEESALQKVWRFILGLFGLDSAPPSNPDPGIVPIEPQERPIEPLPGGRG